MRIGLLFLLGCLALPAVAKKRETSEWVQLNGKKTKLWKGFHANGKRWYLHYWRNDKKVGTHKDFDINGTLRTKVRYRNDVLQGKFETWHENGKLSSRGRYRDGAVDGLFEEFWPTASFGRKRSYADTLPVGEYTENYETGKPRIRGAYEKGVPVGTWTQFRELGNVQTKAEFENGQRKFGIPLPVKFEGPLADADFRFQWVTGSHFEGFNFNLRVEPNGTARLVTLMNVPRVAKKKGEHLRRGELYYDQRILVTEFSLSSRDQKALRQKLAELDPFAREDQYINKNVHDGFPVVSDRSGRRKDRRRSR